MAKLYYDADADLRRLAGRPIAVIGFGSQGHAHALNLRDSGLDVRVGLPVHSRSRVAAERAGLRVVEPEQAAREAQIVVVLTPDHTQAEVYGAAIAPNLAAGKTVLFAHGFSIRYGEVVPHREVDVSLVAPKAPGHRLRHVYVEGGGVPGLVAVHQDRSGHALEDALAYAKAIGCTRAGVIETTFAEETETDLFGEQAVLCGGATELVTAGFETLVEAGYAPEMAYFECLHETKLIVDLLYEGGIANMRYSISNTAEYGDITTGPRIITDETKAEMKRVLADIQSGRFVKNFVLDNRAGQPELKAARKAAAAHPIEQVGSQLRAMMPWIGKNKLVDQEKN